MTKWLLAVICLSAFVCPAQTVQPITQPYQHFVDLSGNPCAGCKLYSYAAGTTTPQPTYTTTSGSVQNTNPVVLDAAGGASICMNQSSYKFVLKNTSGTVLWTVDNILAPTPGGQTGVYLPLAGGTMSGNIGMAGNNILNVGAIGFGTTTPAWPLDVENGAINSSGGYLYNGSAPLNHILLGNGAAYVDSATFPWGSLSGTPTFYYQTLYENGSIQTQEPATQFSAVFTMGDNPGIATDIDLANSGVTAGTYTCVSATVDAYGRITAMSTGTCPTGITQYATTAGGCTTSSSSYSVCTMSVTWPVAFADTSYTAGCSAYNPTDPGNSTSGRAVTDGITAKTTTGVTLQVSTTGSSAISFSGMDCWAHHN